jgi:L-seryl-tRNA(Ser) seleniumtransferase
VASPEQPTELNARLRRLPAVDEVASALDERWPHTARTEAARAAIGTARERVKQGLETPDRDEIVRTAAGLLEDAGLRTMRPVINATGVLIHTNLGRVPLGEQQLLKVNEVARHYSNLEYDLTEGRRGDRYGHAAATIAQVTGAEDALVVNNNAAAVLLVLSALCAEREVIISRGELIEIGGEFRIPDVMTTSTAKLVEVGTTNRTHLGDYERAISSGTAALMKVHTSNYKVVGFTTTVDRRDLARLARGRGVLFVEDLGSGLIADEAAEWARHEPPVARSLEEGADLVTFSGDKLLGGPQAGIIAGRRELVARIKKHPLLRALRVDKMTLAALQATLETYLDGSWRALPFWKMALADPAVLEERARAILAEVETRVDVPAKLEVVPSLAVPGGGSLPGEHVPSWAIALSHPERSAFEIHAALRRGPLALIGRIEDERVLLDLRTVDPGADGVVATLVAGVAQDPLDPRRSTPPQDGR